MDRAFAPMDAREDRPPVPPGQLLPALLQHPKVKPLLSDGYFSADGTLIGAGAGHKSFRPKDGKDKDGEDFRGRQRRNDTHESTAGPESRLYRKANGKESKRCCMGHVRMENRNGLGRGRFWFW